MPAVPGQPGTKPSQLSKPVPGKDALDAALAEMDNAKPIKMPALAANTGGGAAPSGDALDQALASSGDSAPPAAAPDEQPGLAHQAVDYGLRGLDYLGGFSRAGLASAAGLATGQGEIVKPEDLKAAAAGKGPNSAEYLRRLGVSEGGSLNVPGLGRVTLRGAEGLALDVLTDPLTAVAKAVKGSPYLAKLFNAPGQASEALGEAVYKSALPAKARDAAGVLIEEGAPVGGTAAIAQKVKDVSDTMGKMRQGLYDRASQLGAVVDVSKNPLPRAEAVLERMSRDPSLAPAAADLGQLIEKYKGAGAVPLDVISEWKTNLYDALPASSWAGAGGKLRGFAKQFKAALAGDFREAIVNTGNTAEKGLGDSIEALNNKWGTLLSATQPLQKAAQATGGGKLGQMIDGAVLATGGIKAEAIKKGYEIATSPYAKTLVGHALMSAGKNGLATGLANRTLIDANQPEPTPDAERPPGQQ